MSNKHIQLTDQSANNLYPVSPVITVTFNSGYAFNSLPQTVNNAAITEDMVVVQSALGTPSAQIGDWTVAPSNGKVTVTGSISGSTTLTIRLQHSITVS